MYLDPLDIIEMFDWEDLDEYEEIRRSVFDSLQNEQSLESQIIKMP